MIKLMLPILVYLTICSQVFAIEIGEMAPDFVARDMNGDNTLISQNEGKVIVLTFWRTEVRPKYKDNSHKLIFDLSAIEDGFDRRLGVGKIKVIAGSSSGNFRRQTKKRKKKADVHYTFDGGRRVSAKYFNLNRELPITYIIDKKGKIASIHPGYSEDMIDKLPSELMNLVAF